MLPSLTQKSMRHASCRLAKGKRNRMLCLETRRASSSSVDVDVVDKDDKGDKDVDLEGKWLGHPPC